MAKKSRRARRRQAARTRRPTPSPGAPSPQPTAKATRPPATPDKASAAASSPRESSQVDFSREYHYVINDLRTMGVIALAMLGVLIALSFIIR